MNKNAIQGRFWPSKRYGFTLIELLVAILIIGILATVALPQYQKAVLRSRYATLKNITKSIADAQEIYYLEYGTYADRFDRLSMEAGGTPTANDEQRNFDWGSCYITPPFLVACYNRRDALSYVIYFEKSSAQYAGLTYCQPSGDADNKPLQHQLCQQETGSTTYIGTYRYRYTK